MNANIYKISCLTNLHVGNGDVNYNIIDNEVQKDPVTGFPTINSSGVKGALREYFKVNKFSNIDDIFGSEQNGTQKDSTPGKLKFCSANLLARPMRTSKGMYPYFNVTCKTIIKLFLSTLIKLDIENIYGFELTIILKKLDSISDGNFTDFDNSSIEGIEFSKLNENNIAEFLKALIGENWAIMKYDDFKNIDMPVIARNRVKDIENDIEGNLWYEEIVPHQSLFYIPVLIDKCSEASLFFKEFDENVDKKVVQFGGNASIGYGQTYVENFGKMIDSVEVKNG